jgi:hypothetical protein
MAGNTGARDNQPRPSLIGFNRIYPHFNSSKLLKKWLFLRALKNAQMEGSRNPEE